MPSLAANLHSFFRLKMRYRAARNSERGATMVEAALVLPILIALLGGIYDFGRAYHKYQVITDAAREAARYGVTPSVSGNASYTCGATTVGSRPTAAQIQCVAQKSAQYAGVTLTTANITVNQANSITVNGNATTYTTVTVQAPINYLWFKFANANITATANMRNEDN